MCNKWRIFHRAIDVYLDFCDVIVKTCCILHNSVRHRDDLQFQNTLYECSLESIKAVGSRGNVTGTDMGRRAQEAGISLRGGLAGGSSTGDLCVEERSGDGHLSPYGPRWDAWGRGPFTGN
jgi:hypothetical protein